ncbi:MAG: Gldg family protein [Oscillospiraceae bacterium]|nr:Gldg family protein [Oscillospiraceae bacterium]
MEQKVTPEKQAVTDIKTIKKKSFTGYALVLAALALAIVIVLNLLASRLDVTWDMTPASLYKLSDTSTDYLDLLEERGEKVDLYFLVDMDLLSTSNDDMALYYSMLEYDSYDCVNLVAFDPNEDPGMLDEINPDGRYALQEGDMLFRCGENTKHVSGTEMYTYEYTLSDEGNPVVQAAYFHGENRITGAIDAVVTGRTSKVYFLTGHGEKSLSEDYTRFDANLTNFNYIAEELNLSNSEDVPEDAAMIIVAAPKLDISNDEMRKLNEYLDQGGNISFLMSPNEEKQAYKNISAILKDFQIGMDYSIVKETDASLYVNNDPYMFRVNMVASDTESNEDITSEVREMTESNGYIAFMSDTRSFYQILGAEGGIVEVGSLMQTVPTTDASGNNVSTAIGEVCGNPDISAKDITGEVLDLAMYAKDPARNDAKITVFGNADFIDDNGTATDYMIVPVYLYLSTITWMHNSDLDMDMGIADKAKDYDSMTLASATEANTLSVIFIVVPLLVGLIGAGVWLGRRYS